MVDGRAGAVRGVRPAWTGDHRREGHRSGRDRRSRVCGRAGRRGETGRAIRIGTRARRALVQRPADARRTGRPGAADGPDVSARERRDSAGGAHPSAAAPACCISRTPPAPSCGSLAAGFLLLPSLGIQAQRHRVDDRRRARHRAARRWRPGNGGRLSGRSSSRARRSWRGRCCHPATSSTGRWRVRTTANGASRCAKG